MGAPMSVVIQARPIKILLKQALYACANPPAILLSILPAPQQAILSFSENASQTALYGTTNNDDDDDEEEEGDNDDDDKEDQEVDEEEDDDDYDEDDYDDDEL